MKIEFVFFMLIISSLFYACGGNEDDEFSVDSFCLKKCNYKKKCEPENYSNEQKCVDDCAPEIKGTFSWAETLDSKDCLNALNKYYTCEDKNIDEKNCEWNSNNCENEMKKMSESCGFDE